MPGIFLLRDRHCATNKQFPALLPSCSRPSCAPALMARSSVSSAAVLRRHGGWSHVRLLYVLSGILALHLAPVALAVAALAEDCMHALLPPEASIPPTSLPHLAQILGLTIIFLSNPHHLSIVLCVGYLFRSALAAATIAAPRTPVQVPCSDQEEPGEESYYSYLFAGYASGEDRTPNDAQSDTSEVRAQREA
jgi:hypothetical protein